MRKPTMNPISFDTLEEAVALCFRYHAYTALRNISCHFTDGVLVLQGDVHTYYLKQLAQAAVAEIEGIRLVDNQIKVVEMI
jgi:osmotically-inducible protein OsmY